MRWAAGWGRGKLALLNRVVRVDVTETVTIERRHKGCGGVDFAASRGKSIQGRGVTQSTCILKHL